MIKSNISTELSSLLTERDVLADEIKKHLSKIDEGDNAFIPEFLDLYDIPIDLLMKLSKLDSEIRAKRLELSKEEVYLAFKNYERSLQKES